MCRGKARAYGKPGALRPKSVAQAAAPPLASRGRPSPKDKATRSLSWFQQGNGSYFQNLPLLPQDAK